MNMETSVKNIQTLTHEIGRPVVFMEVCGTHTVSAFRTGLRSLLPDAVTLLSGPGCPVCVTPTGYLDTAIAITKKQRTIIATFGDMLRVPGTESSLEREKALGADIRMVYSPTDALKVDQGRCWQTQHHQDEGNNSSKCRPVPISCSPTGSRIRLCP